MQDLEKEVETLRFHQLLLLNAIRHPEAKFDLLIVEKNLTKEEASEVKKICDEMSKRFQREKAEGYLHFQPLFAQFRSTLNPKITVKELIQSCLSQGLYVSFMKEMEKFAF